MQTPKSHLNSGTTALGFVVAMRALPGGDAESSVGEWIIVSRWGCGGNHLSLGWTGLPADPGDTPLQLTPRQTAIAVLDPQGALDSTVLFRLVELLPDQLTVAGDFVPAQGDIRLSGRGHDLRIQCSGRCMEIGIRPDWDLQATREAWVGEFIEGVG